LRTPLGLPGQRRALCTRTSFLPLRDDRAAKAPEIHFYASSAPQTIFSNAELKTLARDHWKIENSLHHVKDRTWLEDRHWMKNPSAAATVAMLRSVACGLARGARGPAMRRRSHCPARIEYFNLHPRRALKLLLHPLRL
jgi:predicted transposase YbfD/YdcC